MQGSSDEMVSAQLTDKELLNQSKQVEELPKEDLDTVIKFFGAYLRDFKAKKAYASCRHS